MVTYVFSLFWLVIGVLISALGAVILRYYNKFAEATGMWNYSRWQLIGFIVIIIGFVVMTNLHTFILSLVVSWVVPAK